MTQAPPDLTKEASDFLLALAHGKYDAQVGAIEEALGALGTVWPPALGVAYGMRTFMALNKATAPTSVVSDGHGGWVPSTNSRIGPDGEFLP